MAEIHPHIRFIIRIIKIVYPAGFVRIYIHDTGMKEIPRATERTRDSFIHNLAIIVDIGRIFRYHHHLIGIYLNIGIAHPVSRVKPIFTQSGCRIIIPFIFIDHLLCIELFLACYRIRIIYAFDCPYFIFIGAFPRYRTAPIQMRSNGFAILIFRDFKQIISAIGRVGQAFADDGIAHPINELPIFRICYFRLVHPKGIHGYSFCLWGYPPNRILVRRSHVKSTTFYQHHTVWCRFIECHAPDSDDFAPASGKRFPARGQQRSYCDKYYQYFFHISYNIRTLLCLFFPDFVLFSFKRYCTTIS